MKQTIMFLLVGGLFQSAFGQGLPKTNLYAFDFSRMGTEFSLSNGRFLSNFNADGYNNQPHFVNNNEIYITSQTPTDGQADIVSLSFLTGIKTQITKTGESEYSPTVMPDRKNISCIRTNAEKKQFLWRYPIDRSNGGQMILKYHTMVGYHAWLSDTTVACFMLENNSNYLAIVNIKDESTMRWEANIGRSLVKLPNGKLAYIAKGSSGSSNWFIKSIDPKTYQTEFITPTIGGSEDFICLSDGVLLMSSGSKLFAFKTGEPNATWKEIADLKPYGIKNIKRIAVSREQDKIVLVNDISAS